MTSERPLLLALSREQTGTLLGTLAWVMGALQIMRDRGHADADEEFHELHDALMPRLEALLESVSTTRQANPGNPRVEEDLERAYTQVREAFEGWIQLTAVDTLSAAVAHRLDAQGDEDAADADTEARD
ncbi:MAG: hypothetical protein GEU80_01770 [Dehalococcoidia bacterium]|nr:hypothetical protein [Dehalococcoidia bacterium]